MQRNQSVLLSHTTYKNKLKIDENLKCKTWNHKNSGRKPRQYNLTFVLIYIYFFICPSLRYGQQKQK